ncbi:glycosyltransferase [Pedobacter panaciterrae]|uniref:glycosyltransferase n=1 Tax=Pedobacter panaciterrae TaxID=363849 RepID=UPI00155DB2C6|nr:glycosyltransferase [Pedobacter panaciterrae]NQX55207.1 glycosyltransferase [Pedobacter panaciterrae]
MRVLVIGNGSTGIDNNEKFFINNHTGDFLLKIKEFHDVTFVQNVTKFDSNNNLQNFDLKSNAIKHELIHNNKSFNGLFRLFRLIKKSDFIYIFFPGTLGRIAGLISIILKKRTGLYIRGQYYKQYKLDENILRSIKFILTVSPHFISDLTTYCDDVEIITPMISIKKEDLFLDRDYSKPEKWNLLFVGRVEERKGIYELLEIASFLKQRNIEFTLNIIGGGDLYSQMGNLIANKGLENDVKLHGQISDKDVLMNFYRAANAFIFTSHDEGFPRVLYEAMASSLPIFTTFVGGIPGRMISKYNCIEIPCKNGEGSGEIVFNGLSDLKLMSQIGTQGQNTISDIINGDSLRHEQLLLNKLAKLS